MKNRRKILLLGATGSVGNTVLQELYQWKDRFELVGVSCNKNVKFLYEIAKKSNVSLMGVGSSVRSIENLKKDIKIFEGENGLVDLVEASNADVVVVAISGIAGLKPTLKAIEMGKTIILASKEVLVIAGDLVMAAAKKYKAKILPLDSEHNAIFQCAHGQNKFMRRLWLTASGGKFLDADPQKIFNATVADVLNHPKWKMGAKITVDSSTMANKGLEVIEAKHLFEMPVERISVAIHPQCIVHSLVEFSDGSFLAQMSPVSMKYATRYCLFYPDRCFTEESSLNLFEIGDLNFKQPDLKKFPCLKFAMQVAQGKQSLAIAFNAANEVAVDLFLREKISFGYIPAIIEEMLSKTDELTFDNIDDTLSFDAQVRSFSKVLAEKFVNLSTGL